MLFSPELHGQLAQERIEREIATAEPCAGTPG